MVIVDMLLDMREAGLTIEIHGKDPVNVVVKNYDGLTWCNIGTLEVAMMAAYKEFKKGTYMTNVASIARTCHNANKAICETFGDNTQKSWEEAEQWQRDSAVEGVEYRLKNPGASPEDQHTAWSQSKLDDGWKYGPVKDATIKEHPCLVPYSELPPEQRAKDAVFGAIVDSMK